MAKAKKKPSREQAERLAKKGELPNSGKVETPMIPIRPDSLLKVRFAPHSRLALTFADGFPARLTIKRLGIPVDQIRWETVTVSADGSFMNVTAITGETVPIEASTLRYLVDQDYAAGIRKALDEICLTRSELRELSRTTKPPAGWTGDPENVPNDPRK